MITRRLVLVALSALAACGKSAPEKSELKVFAAASLAFGLARPSDLDTIGAPFRGRLRTKSAEA